MLEFKVKMKINLPYYADPITTSASLYKCLSFIVYQTVGRTKGFLYDSKFLPVEWFCQIGYRNQTDLIFCV